MIYIEAYRIFGLDPLIKYEEQVIKKKYHTLCLNYHPDKTRQKSPEVMKEYSDYFIQIQNAYPVVLSYNARLPTSDKTNGFESKCINSVLYEQYDDIYKFLLSLYENDFIQDFIQTINTKIKQTNMKKRENNNIVNYFVNIGQLFNKSLYFNEDHNVYIPLWHKIITLKQIQDYLNQDESDSESEYPEQNITFIMKVNITNENIRITENNDIIVYYKLSEKARFELSQNLNNFTTNICLYIDDDVRKDVVISRENVRNGYLVLLHQGIPRCNRELLYDTSDLSHIILLFHKNG